MKRVSIENLKGGEVLARDLISEIGSFVLAKGTILTPGEIARMKNFHIRTVPIEYEKSTYSEEQKAEVKKSISDNVEKLISTHASKESEELSQVSIIASHVMKEIFENEDVLINVHYIRNYSITTYEHSVNVCALAIILGARMQLSIDRIKEMAIGALLHDIGYLYMSDEVKGFKKIRSMSEEDMRKIQRHAEKGLTAVSQEKWLSDTAKEIIYRHHEFPDGSGYPISYSTELLKIEIRIVTVCNEFDRMINGHYTKQTKIHEAVEYILSQTGKKFDVNVVRCFLASIAAYPTETYVRLNTGEIARVIKQNNRMPLKPIINIIYDRDNNMNKADVIVDLTKTLELSIIDVVTGEELKEISGR